MVKSIINPEVEYNISRKILEEKDVNSVIFFTNMRTGDFCICIPAMRSIVDMYKPEKVYIVTDPLVKDLAIGLDFVTDIIHMCSLKEDVHHLINPLDIDLCVMFHTYSWISWILEYKRCATWCVTPDYNNIGIEPTLLNNADTHNKVNSKLMVAESLNPALFEERVNYSQKLNPPIKTTMGYIQKKLKCNKEGIDKYILFSVSNSNLSVNFDIVDWYELAESIMADARFDGYKIVMMFAPYHRMYHSMVENSVGSGDRIKLISTTNDANEFMGWVNDSELVVSPSTGTLHVASCFNVPTVGIFSGSPGRGPHRWGQCRKDKYASVICDMNSSEEHINTSSYNEPLYLTSRIKKEIIGWMVEFLGKGAETNVT